jgi:hypothetical protein
MASPTFDATSRQHGKCDCNNLIFRLYFKLNKLITDVNCEAFNIFIFYNFFVVVRSQVKRVLFSVLGEKSAYVIERAGYGGPEICSLYICLNIRKSFLQMNIDSDIFKPG